MTEVLPRNHTRNNDKGVTAQVENTCSPLPCPHPPP